MNLKSKIISAALAILFLLTAAIPAAVSADDAAPQIIITEVCYNPGFITGNTLGLTSTADVLEYVEFVNISDQTVSLEGITLRYSQKGYEGTFKIDQVLALDGNPMTLDAGEIAVIAIYSKDTAKAKLGYATAEERKAFYDYFVDFYACADRLDENRFYIAPAVESGTDTAIEGGFRFTNSDKDAVIRICDKNGETLCEANYNAAAWNRNAFAVNFFYRPGIVEGHPLASKEFNVGDTTPALIRDNQITSEGLTPTGETVPLKVMQYNVCATDSTQKYPDGTGLPMYRRIMMVFDIIESHQPDVIGLNEINHVWLPHLERTFAPEGGKYAVYGRSGRGSFYGSGKYSDATWDLFNLVLWRTDKYDLVKQGSFWCSRDPDRPNTCTFTKDIVGDMGRAMNWVILKEKSTGMEFFFMCTHMDAHYEEVRTLSAELIANKATVLAEGRPVIMVGDWNTNERKLAYQFLAYGEYADARYRTADLEDMTIYSSYNKWGEFADQHYSRPPIDHCFVSPSNVFVDSAHVDQAFVDEDKTMFASDHNATIYNLRLLLPQAEEPETEPDTTAEETEEPVTTPPETETVVSETEAETETETETKTEESETATQSGCESSVLSVGILFLASLAIFATVKRKE